MVKVSFLIPYSAKESHKNNALAQLATCFRNIPRNVTLHYLVAEGTSVPPEVSNHAIEVPLPDGYFQVLGKTVAGLDRILEDVDPDFVIRGNSSNYYQMSEILRFFSPLNPETELYGGKKTTVSEEMTPLEIPLDYAGGSGIYLSKATALKVAKIRLIDYQGVVDDVAIGHFLQTKGVTLTELHRNDVTDAQPLEVALQTRLKSWESDEHTVRRFHAVHRILEEPSRRKRTLRSYGFFLAELFFLLGRRRLDSSVRLLVRFRPL